MSNVLLRLENISKAFPGVKALQNIRFELKKGEVHVLLGENGAGKSTLVKILSGVYKKDSGDIFIEEQKVDIDSPKKAQELGISTIYQELSLCPHLSVAENVFLGREFTKNGILSKKQQEKATKDLLKIVGVNIEPQEIVGDLTIAKQQVVEIAKALSMNSRILIMDEPTSALSEKEVSELFRVIKELKKRGVGIIYISHKLEELKQIADRVTVLRDGQYIKTVEYNNTDLDELIKLMVGRKLEEKYPRVETKIGKKLLSVKNIRNKWVKDCSFELFAGEIVGLFGLVGAGRSELARAIFGADPMEAGEIYLNGNKINITSPSDAISNGIVYIPENRKSEGLAVEMNVMENLSLPSLLEFSNRLGVINKKREKEFCANIVEKLAIKTPSLTEEVKNLSGGNQQKIVVGKWLMRNPRILIFDEPTRGIDVLAKIEIYNIINSLKQQGKGIIFISSELPEILGICDRVLVMRGGEITASLLTKNTNQEEIMYYATLN